MGKAGEYFRLWNPNGAWVKPYADVDIVSKSSAIRRLRGTCAREKGDRKQLCENLFKIFEGPPCRCKFGEFEINCPAAEYGYVEYCYGKNWRTPSKVHVFNFPC